MTDFSTFFPDDSLPINSYKSFDVFATSNPPGYNASTGIYSNPDGTQWLKTGSIVSGSSMSTYSNATTSNPVASGNSVAPAYDSSGRVCWIDESNGTFAVQHYNPYPTKIAEYSMVTQAATGKTITTDTQFPQGNGLTGGIAYDSVADVIWSFYRYNNESGRTRLKLASYNYSTGANLTNQTIYDRGTVSISGTAPYGIAKINNTPEYVLYSVQNGTEKMEVYDMSSGSASLVRSVNTSLYSSQYYNPTSSPNDNKIFMWKYDAGKYVEFETTNFTATGVETPAVSSFISTYDSYAYAKSTSKTITNNSSLYSEWIMNDFIGDTATTDSISGKPLFRRIG